MVQKHLKVSRKMVMHSLCLMTTKREFISLDFSGMFKLLVLVSMLFRRIFFFFLP